MAERIWNQREQFLRVLSEVDNYHGAVYEITQVVKTLNGVKLHETEFLRGTQGLQNIAVYGSTNIPLYTLILHAVIPASTGAHVWFRTPMASRETYVRSMKLIRDIMPELDLSHIHLLTEPADVQYDNFRKQYVLGLNRKGSRSVRPPADVVIFTGNPRTGQELRTQIEVKLKELPYQLPSVKTIFLQFGSGLNPVVVTEMAAGVRLEPAVQAALQAIRINSSQDCIAPKFYLAHQKIAQNFISRLKSEILRLKYGSRNDPEADYSSLTFSEGVHNLIAFRDKWRSYLLQTGAQIDPVTKRVDPHIFVFPFEKFNEVELVDHYAPFVVLFEYSSKSDLETVANDPRVKGRAMFASIFGDTSNPEMVQMRKMFEDNFHSTILNQSVFVEESGNFPFGGYSEAASSVTVFRRTSGQSDLKTYSYARPILFSREAYRFFGPPRNTVGFARIATKPNRDFESSVLEDMIEGAKQLENPERFGGDWSTLKDPQVHQRPRGLKALQKIIQESGLSVVVGGAAPKTPLDKDFDLLFYGPGALYTSKLKPGEIRKVPGVVLHPGNIGHEAQTLNSYRGDVNPHLGFAFLHPLFSSSKQAEYILANTVWPGSMPRGLSYRDLETAKTRAAFSRLEGSRARLNETLDRLIQLKSDFPLFEKRSLVDEVEAHLILFFEIVNREFPQGAFIKNLGIPTFLWEAGRRELRVA